MNAAEFIGSMQILGLSKLVDAARFFRCDERTVRRWRDGSTPIPAPVSMLVRMMIKHGEKPSNWTD